MLDRGQLGNKFNDFGATPSPELWGAISSNLNTNKKKRAIIWWFSGVGLAACITIAALVFTNKKPQYTERIKSIENDINSSYFNQKETFSFNQKVESDPKKIKNSILNHQANNKNYTQETNKVVKQKTSPIINTIVDMVTISRTKELINLIPPKASPLLAINDIILPNSILENKDRKLNKFEIGLAVKHHFGSKKTTPANSISSDLGLVNPSIPNNILSLNENFSNSPNTFKISKPVGLNLVVRYNLNQKLAIQSGLNWSALVLKSSDKQQKSLSHNIGFPIQLNFSILNTKRLSLGIFGGHLFELPFYKVDKGNLYASEKKLEISKSFFNSVNIGGFIDYRLNESFKLTFSPGIDYYYSNKSLANYPYHLKSTFITASIGIIKQL